jgi:hypothetical protein
MLRYVLTIQYVNMCPINDIKKYFDMKSYNFVAYEYNNSIVFVLYD